MALNYVNWNEKRNPTLLITDTINKEVSLTELLNVYFEAEQKGYRTLKFSWVTQQSKELFETMNFKLTEYIGISNMYCATKIL